MGKRLICLSIRGGRMTESAVLLSVTVLSFTPHVGARRAGRTAVRRLALVAAVCAITCVWPVSDASAATCDNGDGMFYPCTDPNASHCTGWVEGTECQDLGYTSCTLVGMYWTCYGSYSAPAAVPELEDYAAAAFLALALALLGGWRVRRCQIPAA